MSEVRVEYGFRLPPRERSRVVPVEDESEAWAFVGAHPQCEVVQRTVRVGDWVPA